MILTILKVIGIILLILIALVVAAVLSIFFIPVRYSGRGSFDTPDVNADIKITWFLKLVAMHITYDEDLQGYYRIAFVKKQLFESDEETVDDNDNDDVSDTVKGEAPVVQASDKYSETKDSETTNSKTKHSDKTRSDGKKRINQRIDKIKNLCSKLKREYSDSRNKAAIGHLKDELFIVLKKICPKKFSLLLEFSTGEPDKTGILLGILAMFPIGYTNRWQIRPDFESDNAYAKGSFVIKGRIHLVSILAVTLRILFDKNCRRLYNRMSR